MNVYTLLSIFGEGEEGYQNAKILLGVMIICLFVLIFGWIVKKLGIFDGLFGNRDWDEYAQEVMHGEDEDTLLGRAAGKMAKYFDEDFEYGDSIELGSEGKKIIKKKRNRNLHDRDGRDEIY